MQMDYSTMALVPSNTEVIVRAAGNITGFMDSIRRTNDRISKDEVITQVQTMHEIIESSLASQRFAMMLLGAFAALALVLAGIGLYGVIAYVVGQRTNEIGIRMALGAQRGNVLRWVLWQGTQLALAGVIVGLVAAAALTFASLPTGTPLRHLHRYRRERDLALVAPGFQPGIFAFVFC
jgi:ABC-type antimicrobial peptide transport system permease subunit